MTASSGRRPGMTATPFSAVSPVRNSVFSENCARTASFSPAWAALSSTRSRKKPSRPPTLKHGPPQLLKSRRALVARLAQHVDHAHGPALEQLLRAGHHRIALEHHVGLRDDQLHGDLPAHVDVLQQRRAGRADEDQRRGQRARRDLGRRQRHRGVEDDVGGARAERRVALEAQLPRQGQPERRLRVLREWLGLHVGDPGLPELLRGPCHGLRARGEAGDAAPLLAAADLLARAALLREPDDRVEVRADGDGGELGHFRIAWRHHHRTRPARAHEHRGRGAQWGRQGQAEPGPGCCLRRLAGRGAGGRLCRLPGHADGGIGHECRHDDDRAQPMPPRRDQ